jgi:hypothetical protein
MYGAVDSLTAPPARAATSAPSELPEQHLLQGTRVIVDDGVLVNIPPLHHQVVTAELTVGTAPGELRAARETLERALAEIERRHAPTPAGLGIVVAWGTPYFRRYVPRLHGAGYPAYLPVDRAASREAGKPVPALFDIDRFPSDPETTRLERNDVCVVLQSDVLSHITSESPLLFKELSGVMRITSVRRGFVGGGFGGERSLPKRMAMRAGVPGASLIPDRAQLFLGFTSTQRASIGPDRIANLETIPDLTDQWPHGYFRHGTTLHLSHLYEDLQLWYQANLFVDRVWLATDLSRAANNVFEGTLTLPEGPGNVQSEQLVEEFATDPDNGLVGHSASMQPVNRLFAPIVDNYGVPRSKGTAILQRVDFNTLDNPFYWTARPAADGHSSTPAAGMHFLAFSPTTDLFRRMRLAMDGRYADGVTLPIPARSARMGLNGVLATTHRQHFLVPPRRSRSFPLSELL